MKFYEASSDLQFPWDQVAMSFWWRYPNPFSTHVLSEDTIFREVRGDQIWTKRLLTKTNKLPKWGEKIVPGPRYVCVIEESVVDRKNNTLTTYTRNMGYTKLMTIEEKCTYTMSEESDSCTHIKKQAWILSNVYGLSKPIMAFGLDRFKKNATKAFQGFEYVLNQSYLPQNQVSIQKAPQLLKTEKIKHTAKQAKERATVIAKDKAKQVVASVGKTANCSKDNQC